MSKYFSPKLTKNPETEPALFKKATAAGVKIAYGTDIGGYDWNVAQTKDFDFMVTITFHQ